MISLVFETKLVSDTEQATWMGAYDKQLTRDYGPSWGRVPPMLSLNQVRQKRDPIIRFVDKVDIADALGYHTLLGGIVVGIVGVQTCLDYGASPSACGSHELLEACRDPFLGSWSDCWASRTSFADEIADPVQDGEYLIDGIKVSNFVYPEWSLNEPDPSDRFDCMGALSAPFTKTSGGYYVSRTGGQGTEVTLGEKPPWKVAAPISRSLARMRKPGPLTLDLLSRHPRP